MSAKSIYLCHCFINAINDDLQAFDRDILVVRFGECPLVQKYMCEFSLFVNLLKEYAVPENKRGITTDINRPCYFVNTRLTNDNSSTVINCLLHCF